MSTQQLEKFLTDVVQNQQKQIEELEKLVYKSEARIDKTNEMIYNLIQVMHRHCDFEQSVKEMMTSVNLLINETKNNRELFKEYEARYKDFQFRYDNLVNKLFCMDHAANTNTITVTP